MLKLMCIPYVYVAGVFRTNTSLPVIISVISLMPCIICRTGQYEKIMNLRTVNPDLKILLAIGGWTHGTAPFTAVVDDPNDTAAFAANALTYLKTYQFDGLDLDWEYPGGNGSPPEDKQRFTSFVQVGIPYLLPCDDSSVALANFKAFTDEMVSLVETSPSL